MITSDEPSLRALHALVRACTDSERGFLRAGDAVPEPELVQLFAGFAVQRAQFASALRDRIRTLRGNPDDAGTIGGDLHRAWMGVETAIASNEVHALLSECERGEDMSVGAYRDALAVPDLDEQTRRLIQQQYEQVQAAHDRVRQLRDSATYAHR